MLPSLPPLIPLNAYNLNSEQFETKTVDYMSLLMNEEIYFDYLAKKTTVLSSEELFPQIVENSEVSQSAPYIIARFDNIRCPRETILKLEASGQYLHANRINLTECSPLRVATQAPLSITKGLFWEIILQEKSLLIVDLTMPHEVDLKESPIHIYYPEIGQTLELPNGLFIQHLTEESFIDEDRIILAQYKIYTKNKEKEHILSRFHFQTWPDRQAITAHSLAKIVSYIHKIETSSQIHTPGPTFVHCRAGISRTASVLIALALYDLHLNEQLTSTNIQERLDELILNGRKQRGEVFIAEPCKLPPLIEYAYKLCKLKEKN
ncbi:MAG: putative tyrosine-protein phosphatase [Chlamydiales bacterium]|jgi:protein tyrosine phosphatase|nr:putative tyrosine-protein phosphatase [Chlamydiales bacterium]